MSYPQMPPPPSGLPPAGWYLDPTTPDQQRYWNGTAWTDNVAPKYRYGPPPTTSAPLAPPAYSAPVAAALVGPGGVPYASFWRRLSGLIIDALVFLPVTLILMAVALGPTLGRFADCVRLYGGADTVASQEALSDCIVNSGSVDGVIWISLVLAGLNVAYFTICLAIWGRTIGGLAVGIRCVTASGANPTWAKAFVRSVIPFGFSLLSLAPFVGIFASIAQLIAYLAMLWSPKRQTWMDRAAGTFVIKPERNTPL